MEPDAADLVEQLKNNATALWLFDPQDELPALMNQAAKEIERLRAGLAASPSEELVKALEKLVEAYRERDKAEDEANSLRMHDVGTKRWDAAMDAVLSAEAALAALRTTKEGGTNG